MKVKQTAEKFVKCKQTAEITMKCKQTAALTLPIKIEFLNQNMSFVAVCKQSSHV